MIRSPIGPRLLLGLLVLVAVALPAPAASASPYIHAHRGGSLVEGVPAFGENTMAAFRNSAELGFVLEMDAKLTADGVAVVIHDATLKRTTDCTGRVDSRTLAQLASCRVDILGTTDNFIQLDPGDPRREPIPTVEETLRFAASAGAGVNLEIKNFPTDPDFDLTNRFASRVIAAIRASEFPLSRLIVQSFWPLNLNVVENRLPAADTSLLTSHTVSGLPLPTNELGPAVADVSGYEWVSPQWQPSALVVPTAHTLGLQVVPYTLNRDGAIAAAYRRGVDAVISDDPTRARRVIAALEPEPPAPPPPPSEAACDAASASRTAAPIEAYDPEPAAPRVFAIQFKQELRHVRTYASFRTKVECLIRDHVLPRLASGRPNVVALNEDVGLMTIATGSRGALARSIFGNPSLSPSCPALGQPCGALGALATVGASYAIPLGAYEARYLLAMQPLAAPFVAATDTFARGWMQTFSDLAKRYGIYILGSNNQAPFRESRDPAEIALFRDPDRPAPRSVFVATEPEVYNEVFMWGPEDVRREGPLPLRNVVARNKKVPLTPTERTLQLTPGPASGPDAIENLRPFELPGSGARIGFATSKPAFEYDGAASPASFGREFDPGLDPCDDTARFYMRCLDRLGANVVIQDEANGGGPPPSGIWPADSGEGNWQPLEWNRSTWRAAADPSVSFDYNVTPFMVGNLADLGFDGQTSITQRGLRTGPGCHYVGAGEFIPDPPERDPEHLRVYSGPKTEFVAIVPWVAPDGPRDELRATGARLAPGSGDPLENDYLETSIAADLPFPPNPDRPSCAGAGGGAPGAGPGSGVAGQAPAAAGSEGKRKRCRGKRKRGAARRPGARRLGADATSAVKGKRKGKRRCGKRKRKRARR